MDKKGLPLNKLLKPSTLQDSFSGQNNRSTIKVSFFSMKLSNPKVLLSVRFSLYNKVEVQHTHKGTQRQETFEEEEEGKTGIKQQKSFIIKRLD